MYMLTKEETLYVLPWKILYNTLNRKDKVQKSMYSVSLLWFLKRKKTKMYLSTYFSYAQYLWEHKKTLVSLVGEREVGVWAQAEEEDSHPKKECSHSIIHNG